MRFWTGLFLAIGLWAQKPDFLPVELEKKVATAQVQKSYCRPNAADDRFCWEYRIRYAVDAGLPDEVAAILRKRVARLLAWYEVKDPRKEVDEVLKEDGPYHGEYYEYVTLTLFAVTPGAVVLRIDDALYTGGAHGSFETDFENYDRRTGKRLDLDGLIRPSMGPELTAIAERAYRRHEGLGPKQSLQDADWFENRFVLSDAFAIVPEGLLFLYNQYEIKPYADGQTRFVVPLSALRGVLKSEKYWRKP
jgi:hypothetical protein